METNEEKTHYIQGSLGQIIIVVPHAGQVSLCLSQVDALGISPETQIPGFDRNLFDRFYRTGYGENRMLRGWLTLNIRRLKDAGLSPKEESTQL